MFRKMNWVLIAGFMVLVILVSGGITYYFKTKKQEKITIDPQVEIAPDKEYQITYWDYPLFIGQDKRYKEFIEETIKEYSSDHPNIKINYKLLSFAKGREKLQERVNNGNPPDIYNAIFGNKLISEKLQIPVSIYFSEEEINKYSSVALNSFKYNEQLWGVPQWLIPEVWVGNKQVLDAVNLNTSQIINQGWSRDDFHQVSLQLKNLSQESGIIFNPHNPRLIYQLLFTVIGEQKLINGNQELLINSRSVEKVFKFLDSLRREEVFPVSVTKRTKKMLPYFWQDKIGVMAPVNNWLLTNLYQRRKEENTELVLLPIPGDNDRGKSLISTAGLLLFRQEEYKGDDHTKAAYQFAKFMNRQKLMLISKRLKVIPALLSFQSKWKKEAELNKKIKEQLLTYIERGKTSSPGGFENEKLEAKLKEVINKNYKRYWMEDLAVEEVKRDMIIDCKQAVSIYQDRQEE